MTRDATAATVVARNGDVVLSDAPQRLDADAIHAFLADVFVLPAHRGQGHATRLLRTALTHPMLACLRRRLLATRDAHALYARAGFAPRAPTERFMEIRRPDLYRGASG